MDTTLARSKASAAFGPTLTEEQARKIYRQGEEAVVLALMTMAKKLAALSGVEPTPTTPSAMIDGSQLSRYVLYAGC